MFGKFMVRHNGYNARLVIYLQSLNIVLGLKDFPVHGLQSVNTFTQGLMDDVGTFVLVI